MSLGQKSLPHCMFNGKFLKALLKETQFDKALYSSDQRGKKKKSKEKDSVKLISGIMSWPLLGTIY